MNETAEISRHRDYTGARTGMWLFIFSEMFFFFGPFLLFGVFRYRYPDDFHTAAGGLDIALGALNTVILLTSSLTMTLSISSLRNGRKTLATALLVVTALFGVWFLFNKYLEWNADFARGFYPNSAILLGQSRGQVIFYGLYFFTLGLHGLHVLAGVVLLSVIAYMVHREKINKSDMIKLDNTGLYWHLVDVIWTYLFPLFYLIN